jgi:hypothetical protein
MPFKFALVFTLQFNGADFFRMTKKSVCFVQDRRDEWGNIAWKQTVEVSDDTIDPKKG